MGCGTCKTMKAETQIEPKMCSSGFITAQLHSADYLSQLKIKGRLVVTPFKVRTDAVDWIRRKRHFQRFRPAPGTNY